MQTYSQRAELCTNPAAIRLLKLMDEKQTNLCVAADITQKQKLLEFIDLVGPEVCVIKTHIDIVEDFDMDLIIRLERLSEKHRFLLFEDRKFADIGNTVKHQYQDGIYHIADWAQIVNAHSVPGPGVVEGLRDIGLRKGRGLLLLAEMSTKNHLARGEYTQSTLAMAEAYKNFVIGFITQKKLLDDSFINFAPGVKMKQGSDPLGQLYNTPEKMIIENEIDVIIVGRGIYQADDPLAEAKQYRAAGWQAYQDRL